MKNIDQYWYQTDRTPPLKLRLLSVLFGFIALLRRFAYRIRILPSAKMSVPLIVIGNITAGGSGKSPMVIWLANALRSRGYTPGIISRGYGGKANSWPQLVRPDGDPGSVGDEAIMIARRTRCPMVVGPQRVKAARALVKHWPEVDVILSDDGMQHYALRRDVEICIVDGERRLGNGYFLPAGPLREPASRLGCVDLVICNGGTAQAQEHAMHFNAKALIGVNQVTKSADLADFAGQTVHAVAGIGYPERFFRVLEQAGITVIGHPFPDHHAFWEEDISFGDDLPVFMTEKDAVKCERFQAKSFWFLPVEADFSVADSERMLELIIHKIKNGIKNGQ